MINLLKSILRWRPSGSAWKPYANAVDQNDIDCYDMAAKKLGIGIRFGYPVPSPAGRAHCAKLGLTGVYIKRDNVDREKDLHSEFFNRQLQRRLRSK